MDFLLTSLYGNHKKFVIPYIEQVIPPQLKNLSWHGLTHTQDTVCKYSPITRNLIFYELL